MRRVRRMMKNTKRTKRLLMPSKKTLTICGEQIRGFEPRYKNYPSRCPSSYSATSRWKKRIKRLLVTSRDSQSLTKNCRPIKSDSIIRVPNARTNISHAIDNNCGKESCTWILKPRPKTFIVTALLKSQRNWKNRSKSCSWKKLLPWLSRPREKSIQNSTLNSFLLEACQAIPTIATAVSAATAAAAVKVISDSKFDTTKDFVFVFGRIPLSIHC
mmetsp:Transcript_15098/g.38045  ORF Transcript_15098/g.38045 Transcript_15098/m.38045 type:complete len:215 (+) Transcript_15098:38-682(+)